jgi:hypothetical protein
MKTYKKAHSNAKAAKNHENSIKKRGGNVTSKKEGSKIVLTYDFPSKKK